MNILIFGGGDMAEKGIIPVVGGRTVSKDECDVRSYDEVFRCIARERPDAIIFTAGVSHPWPVVNSDADEWREEIETNLLGAYHVAKASAMHGIENMIFIASVAGKYGKPHHSGYSASKGGVISLVQSLGMEGYNAYAISPGRVDTKMREKDYPDDKPGTRLEPTEVGDVVLSILAGDYEPGDNIIVRRIGYETAPITVDKGEPWKTELKVGSPKTL